VNARASRPVGTLRLVVILGLISGFGSMSVDLYLPAMPQVADTFHASAAAVQVSLTVSVVGIGVGQLFVGPFADAVGRRLPVALGLAVFMGFSIGCALAPSLLMLIVFRFGQALGGAAGQVTARAIARDLRSGRALANLYATLVVVTGLTPLLAPIAGAQLMLVGSSWRTIFLAQAAFGAALAVISGLFLRESLPKALRTSGASLGATVRHYTRLVQDRPFVTFVLAGACCVATVFSFVAASSFVLQDIYGLSARSFSLCFAASGVGLLASSQLSRFCPTRARLVLGTAVMVAGSGLQALAVFSHLNVAAIVLGAFVMWCGFGAAGPAALALAMSGHRDDAGSAAAVFGAVQFGFGGIVGPLVGLAGRQSAVPMVVMLLFWSSLAVLCAMRAFASSRTDA
jgi:MFS transporter, DHA1 family, multidrug resistance protein